MGAPNSMDPEDLEDQAEPETVEVQQETDQKTAVPVWKTGKVKVIVLEEPYWGKQKGETPRQFAAFQIARDMDPLERGPKEVAKKYGCTVSYIEKLQRTRKWQVRLEAYQIHLDEELRELARKEREEAFKRHREQGQAMQQIGSAKFQQRIDEIVAIQKRAEAEGVVAQIDITDAEAARLSKLGIDIERLSMGEATSRTIIETPMMIREALLRDAVEDARTAIEAKRAAGKSPDEMVLWTQFFVREIATHMGIPEEEIAAAVVGQVSVDNMEGMES